LYCKEWYEDRGKEKLVMVMLTVFHSLLGVFMVFGLSGVVPAVHYAISEGWFNAISRASLGWLILMGCLYILGAMFYALRVPERFFPGKCDIWVCSHVKVITP
jgi:predicted membrane channel-forming protein YqfA (hemolysin III family)